MEQKYIPKDGRWIMENSGIVIQTDVTTFMNIDGTEYKRSLHINGVKYISYNGSTATVYFIIDKKLFDDMKESIIYLISDEMIHLKQHTREVQNDSCQFARSQCCSPDQEDGHRAAYSQGRQDR